MSVEQVMQQLIVLENQIHWTRGTARDTLRLWRDNGEGYTDRVGAVESLVGKLEEIDDELRAHRRDLSKEIAPSADVCGMCWHRMPAAPPPTPREAGAKDTPAPPPSPRGEGVAENE